MQTFPTRKVSLKNSAVQAAGGRMASHDPNELREFAATIVRRLRGAGHQALWAGGCVRDRLLGLAPKDYDVATSASPQEIAAVFGDRRTLGIGAAFGVMAVLGPRQMRVEVATFRQDGRYLDGRHPEEVTFSTAEKDAQRRDFTINGLFFDPVTEQVIDYVGGVDDLRHGVVRAIGDPRARFDEDKLRMLRAVRFSTTYNFELDQATLEAIQSLAGELVIVSAERIAEEMRKLLPHPRRARGVELLREARLLEVILPEAKAFAEQEPAAAADATAWARTLRVLDALERPTFPVALAAMLRELGEPDAPDDRLVEEVGGRWRLSNDEIAQAAWVRRNETAVRTARRIPWPRLQRILIGEFIDELLVLADAAARVLDGSTGEVEFCRSKLALPEDELNPKPLLDGNDLIRAGLTPGPLFHRLLETVRDAQLVGRIKTKDEALTLALSLSFNP
jgi:tRNA nucleotidyltransferase/poly(A) polymerase